LSIDLLDEDAALLSAMTQLAQDSALREGFRKAGREYWRANHRLELMADDYRRVIAQAASVPARPNTDLPAHLTEDHSALATSIAREVGVDLRL
jgi:hypothetical protein